jgi:hypothetical protein
MAARSSGSVLLHLLETVEQTAALDGAAARLARVLDRVVPRGPARQALRGEWLGHAFHPMISDFVEGPWMACNFLDVFGPWAARGAAQRLLGFGLLMSIPAHLSGWVEWLEEPRPDQRRVGLLHLAGITSATALYGVSYALRRKDHHFLGAVMALGAGLIALGDGYLGGHMSHVRLVATGEKVPASAAPG